jgi:hypothetical protein
VAAPGRHTAAALVQVALLHSIELIALAEGVPIQAIGGFQENFMRFRRTPATVTGAEQHIHLFLYTKP